MESSQQQKQSKQTFRANKKMRSKREESKER